VLHLNEGHSGFAVFEAIRDRMEEEGLDFNSAASQIPREVILPRTRRCRRARPLQPRSDGRAPGPLREQLGISHENMMGFGREYPTDPGELLHDGAGPEAGAARECGLLTARRGFAGDVEGLYPGKPEDAVPIGHITNGVHVPSWLAPQMCRLYDRHLGVGWQSNSGSAATWEED
jgi:starch phosphorylase